MAQRFLEYAPAPVRDPIVEQGRGGLLSHAWEAWFHRLPHSVLERPSCHIARSTNQSIDTATWTTLLFNSEEHDNAAMHNTTSNTDRITIPSDGIYAMGAYAIFAANGTGTRSLQVSLNNATPGSGAILQTEIDGLASLAVYFNVMGTRTLSGGDILRCDVWQNSGGALNLLSSGLVSPRFWCFKVSD